MSMYVVIGLRCLTLCVVNLVSLFELNWIKDMKFSLYSNLLRCTTLFSMYCNSVRS